VTVESGERRGRGRGDEGEEEEEKRESGGREGRREERVGG
jgi:hypothetical protein